MSGPGALVGVGAVGRLLDVDPGDHAEVVRRVGVGHLGPERVDAGDRAEVGVLAELGRGGGGAGDRLRRAEAVARAGVTDDALVVGDLERR